MTAANAAAAASEHRREALKNLKDAVGFAARDELGAILLATAAGAEASFAVADEVRALRLQMLEAGR